MGPEVLWLASSEPPSSLITFLRSRGLSLVAREAVTSSSPLRLLWIEASAPPSARAPNLTGRRIAVMHPDPGNADALAQALRAKGAEVVALSLNPETLQRAETLDPDAVIMEAGDFCSSCWEIVRALWQHPRLRFATVVLATPDLMGTAHISALDVHDLSFAIAEVSADYARISGDAKREDRFSFELERLGPSRSLRALLEAGRTLRVLVKCGADSMEIDLAEHIVVGAQSPAGAAPGEGLLGVHALQLLLAQREGQVEVRVVDHPAHTNVMAPLDTALHMAHESASAVRPSGMHRPVAGQAGTLPGAAQHASPPGAAQHASSPLHSRTLIGVPAVRLPLPGKAEPPALANAEPAVPAKSQAPARAKSQAPLPNTAPPTPAFQPARVKAERPARKSLAPAQAPAASLAPAAATAPVPVASPAPVPLVSPAAVPANANAEPPPVRIKATFTRARSDAPSAAPPAVPNEPLERAAVSAPTPRVSTVPYAERASLAPAAPLPRQSVPPTLPAAAAPAFSPSAAVEIGLPLSAGESNALDELALDADWARPAPSWQRRLRELASPRRLAWAGLGLAALLVLGGLARGFRSHAAPVPSLPVARAAPASSQTAPARAPEVPAVQPVPEPAADRVAAAEPEDEPHVGRVSARRASQLVNQGNAFRRKKMLPSARSRYLDALHAFPGYPRALSGLTQLALGRGAADEARDFARQLVQARPGQAAYQLLLGDALRAGGQLKEARAAYQVAERLGSDDAKQRLEAL